jgi:hypothetical protein
VTNWILDFRFWTLDSKTELEFATSSFFDPKIKQRIRESTRLNLRGRNEKRSLKPNLEDK